jgi:hypothetical protein
VLEKEPRERQHAVAGTAIGIYIDLDGQSRHK